MRFSAQFTAHGKDDRSIFSTIFGSLLVVVLIEAILLQASLTFSGVTDQLDQLGLDIFEKRVENRASFLSTDLIVASDLTELSTSITDDMRELTASGKMKRTTFDNSTASAHPLLEAVAPRLKRLLSNRMVTGAFLILNRTDLAKRADGTTMPCLYLRRGTTEATASRADGNIVMAYGPRSVAEKLDAGLSSNWRQSLPYRSSASFTPVYRKPFQAAYNAKPISSAGQFGCWSEPYALPNDYSMAIAYAEPLVDAGGAVCGIVGVELQLSTLYAAMPSSELDGDDYGFYLLAHTSASFSLDTIDFTVAAATTGSNTGFLADSTVRMTKRGGHMVIQQNGTEYTAAFLPLNLYANKANASGQRWVLIGAVESRKLFAFSDRIQNIMVGIVVMLVLAGLCSSFVVSSRLARPVATLSAEVNAAQRSQNRFPHFSRTGITELDQLANAITDLTRESGASEALERVRIERERDYDSLTSLYNRHAFRRTCEALISKPESLGCAAMVIIDLDDLKAINNNYSHDWGDELMRTVAQNLVSNAPSGTVCGRLSGDEFLLFFHGYADCDELRATLAALHDAIEARTVTGPDGRVIRITASGGIAWYPTDGTTYNRLALYADFTMGLVKQSRKGEWREFNITQYHQKAFDTQLRADFAKLLKTEAVTYHFQPIYSARTGRPYAYEALMRPVGLETLRSPAEVMRLAHEQDRLYDIEKLTMFRAGESFLALKERHIIPQNTLLFINSIASVSLNDDDWALYLRTFPTLPSQTVIEITEEEQLNMDALNRKRTVPGGSRIFALDDYGSGYSNSSNLLTLAPRYVKVDISIIRGIDADTNKQELVRSLVEYARPRNMMILAEGVETDAELRCVLDLGVDLLQGYGLSRPAAEPVAISSTALDVIRDVFGRV